MDKTPGELAYYLAKVLEMHGYITVFNVHTVRVILEEALRGQES